MRLSSLGPWSGWVTMLFGAALVACGSTAPEPEVPAGSGPAAEPSGSAVRAPTVKLVTFITDGVQVKIEGGAPGKVVAHLRLASGGETSAVTDSGGVIVLKPGTKLLFENADTPTAELVVGSAATHVDLTPLIEDEKQNHPEAWARILEERTATAAKAEQAVNFGGRFYRDRSTGAFVEACTPTGSEQCGDGIDNDCDGRYDDKNCGYVGGALQWTATWNGNADLDLHVVGPDDVEVSSAMRHDDKTGIVLDRECGGSGRGACGPVNVENAALAGDHLPMGGTYTAWVEVSDPKGADATEAIPCRLSGRIGSRTWYADVKLAPYAGASYRIAYAIGADRDRDGVPDAYDACPDAKGCFFSELKYRGCPDSDGDGEPDSADACPDKAGLTAEEGGKNGCPLVFGKAWVTNRGIEIHDRIEFAFGKADLKPESRAIIRDVAKAMKARPQAAKKMSIDGHTDDVGEGRRNIGLSAERASAVFHALTAEGVPEALLVSRGFGETHPIADNSTPQGRQENRRVEFVLLDPKPHTSACF